MHTLDASGTGDARARYAFSVPYTDMTEYPRPYLRRVMQILCPLRPGEPHHLPVELRRQVLHPIKDLIGRQEARINGDLATT